MHQPNNIKAEESMESTLVAYLVFFAQNPEIKQTFLSQNVHQKYGFVNKTQLLELPNGTYIGRSVDKVMQGIGIMLFSQGMYYEGEWSHGKIQGKGVFIFQNGEIYDGDWRNNLPHGRGVY